MTGHLRLLGYPVRDEITGFTGMVTTISFDIAGCVQGYVVPRIDKDGKLADGHWFDTKRLTANEGELAIPQPTFQDVSGGQELPPPRH